jgi:hypothetical protein
MLSTLKLHANKYRRVIEHVRRKWVTGCKCSICRLVDQRGHIIISAPLPRLGFAELLEQYLPGPKSPPGGRIRAVSHALGEHESRRTHRK